MTISVFNIFSIGIGPSSSHTVGPMRAARKFILDLQKKQEFAVLSRLSVELYGSLALTGKGHWTDIAVLLGLEGESPEKIDPDQVQFHIERIRQEKKISIAGNYSISYQDETDLIFHYDKQLPFHPNGMRFTAYDREKKQLFQQVYYSLGGGFIVEHEEAIQPPQTINQQFVTPYPFKTSAELIAFCEQHQLTIAELMWENEKTWRSAKEIKEGLDNLWKVMQASVKRGCEQEGILPGGLQLKRRAAGLYRFLQEKSKQPIEKKDPAEILDWISLWALAVNEENASGGRVVTAPTNGAAGVIPSVLHYYVKFIENASTEGIENFLLTAAAIGILYKEGASISAAEMGCMGEVGVACSMAAAGLVAAQGGTNAQIENAAEIGMEHNLGLTCDPVGGLVQIPCIERNTMGATKAINAARLAYHHGDGTHKVSLDQVISTMKQTGQDMLSIYKETSQGGLAVNVPAC